MRLILYILVFFVYIGFFDVNAQQTNSDGSDIKNSSLFVHFDKNIYLNNEDAWFTGYILNTQVDLSLHNTLYISIVSSTDSTVIFQEKFLIENGIAFGSINLPETISSGNYVFIANTNLEINNEPELCFVQRLTVNSNFIDPMILILENKKLNDLEGSVLVKTISKDNHFVEKAKLSFQVIDNNNLVLKGVGYTNTIGEFNIKYPLSKITFNNTFLEVTSEKGAIKRSAQLKISKTEKRQEIYPPPFNEYQLNFYPEGGYLVEDLVSVVGAEAKKGIGNFVKARIVLLKNGVPFDTVATNSYGMANFSFKPIKGYYYTSKILVGEKSLGNYPLPKALKNGIVLKMSSVSKNDVLPVYFRTKGLEKVIVVLHSKGAVHSKVIATLNQQNLNRLLLNISKIPIGLTTITVLDDLGRPLAERVFFAHQNKINNLDINIENKSIRVRDSVSINLQAKDFVGKRLFGKVSLASVTSASLTVANHQNIIDYTYLGGAEELAVDFLRVKDSVYLNNLLMIRQWRKYKWLEKSKDLTESSFISELEYEGQIFRGEEKLKGIRELTLLNGKRWVNLLTTDSMGKFKINNKNLITPYNKDSLKLTLVPASQEYIIKLFHPSAEVIRWISTLKYPSVSPTSTFINSSIRNPISSKAIKLKDVKITKVKDRFGSTSGCSDYVCMYNILNCINHVGHELNRAPKKGDAYFYRFSEEKEKVFYTECIGSRRRHDEIAGIHLPKEFYKWDVKDVAEPLNSSTIYWNYQINLNNKQPTPIKFYTGDLTGSFTIIVQGITENGVVYGEKEFTVVK